MAKLMEVVVGNVGTVYSGDDESAARLCYKEYVEASRVFYGRAAGEMVALLADGEIMEEYQGRREEE